jgi:hypothetical protein
MLARFLVDLALQDISTDILPALRRFPRVQSRVAVAAAALALPVINR